MKIAFLISLFCIFFACEPGKSPGNIERLDPSLDSILNPNAEVEIIADGFTWSEGPLWLEDKKMLLFSDVPANAIYKWTETKGKEIYLQPSGYTGTAARGGETGSNGLLLNREGRLVLCQHGNRQIALMDAPLDEPKPVYSSIAGTYQLKKFNSPNDAVYRSNDDLFFTDPPYGLEKNMEDPLKEIAYQGVYLVKASGQVLLLTDTISRPNGIALTPDEKTLIVANSDPQKPFWYAFDIAGDTLLNGRIFYDASKATQSEKGLPDGLKIDSKGNMFATGPGGVWIFNKDGKLAGKIKVVEATSNCALSKDEKTLFVTATMHVLRIKIR
jgi:gluconolactonase